MKYIIVDIDGTICTQEHDGNYYNAKPILENIAKINKLFDDGNTIEYYTARGTTTGIYWLQTTEAQLQTWGCKYHKLSVGKKDYDVWIDDKAKRIEELSESTAENSNIRNMNIVESNDRCDYCTGKVTPKRCDSCDALSGDCFVGRKLQQVG